MSELNEYEVALLAIGSGDNLVAAITYEAYGYWERAGCTEDFCLQYANLEDGTLIFGSVNRVAWSMAYGFRLLPEFCTKRFVMANSNV